ncbi:MAG: ABC transporter ATP-binding protein, partial [Gammaproteobacteria bacterium]|nr:ABC transporter ATP-binding protein [Gammaproteobacteria bacterium]
EEMQFEIRRIQKQIGVTMVYVTHDQQEAMVLSDRIAVFESGKIQQIAPPEALYEEPTEVFVSGFFGENNKLFGTLTAIEKDKDTCIVEIADQEVQAVPIGDLEVGSEVQVVVRPERVKILWEDEQFSNQFEAKIDDIVFLGDHLRLVVSVLDSDDFLIKIPNIAGHGRVLPGDRVTIGWAQLDCRAILPKQPNST